MFPRLTGTGSGVGLGVKVGERVGMEVAVGMVVCVGEIVGVSEFRGGPIFSDTILGVEVTFTDFCLAGLVQAVMLRMNPIKKACRIIFIDWT